VKRELVALIPDGRRTAVGFPGNIATAPQQLKEKVLAAIQKSLIIGGGVAGLSAAISFRRYGIDVDLIEKNVRNSVLGVGIILQGNALRALQELGLLELCLDAGFPFSRFVHFDANGENAHPISGHRMVGDNFSAMLGITRPAYSAILTNVAEAAGTNIRYGVEVRRMADEGTSVDVEFSDGSRSQYELVIGADGIYSATRQQLFGSLGTPVYCGQSGWRYNLPRPHAVDDLWVFDAGNGGKTGFVPLREDLMYVFLTDTSPIPVPPPDLLQGMKERLAPFGGRVGKLRDKQMNDPTKVLWRPFETVDLPAPWYKGRIIVIGDAAHAMTAHLAQGGAMAIEDSVVLGEELAKNSDVSAALDGFMSRRYARCRFIQDGSMQICRWEIDKTPNANFVGVTTGAMERVREAL